MARVDDIRLLERKARALELDGPQRKASLSAVADYADAFLETLDQRPAFRLEEEMGRGLYDLAIGEKGKPMAQLLACLADHVDNQGVNGASGGHLAYIPISALFHGALGDFLAAVTNRYASVFYTAPGAVRMEHQLLRWMADLLGLPENTAGSLSSGGSLAHLTAIVTAREAHGLCARDFEKTVLYMTAETHHCVDKALKVAGMGEVVIRRVAMDQRYRMQPGALEKAIAEDYGSGLHPWMVVANAGTTNTGALDPLSAIGEITARRNLWFHVDAAYGGFFTLVPELRSRLRGIERADSVVLDPHKGLFIPAGLGAVLVRNGDLLEKAHDYQAVYLRDARGMAEERSPAELGPELTKHYRALRLWLPLHFHGLAAYRAALHEKVLLANYAHERLAAMKGFEVGPSPELSVVTFRFVPSSGDPDQANRRLFQDMLDDGRLFLSSTELNGAFTLRLVPLSFRTHLAQVDLALDLLRKFSQKYEHAGS